MSATNEIDITISLNVVDIQNFGTTTVLKLYTNAAISDGHVCMMASRRLRLEVVTIDLHVQLKGKIHAFKLGIFFAERTHLPLFLIDEFVRTPHKCIACIVA